MKPNSTDRPHGYARYKLDNCRCHTCGWACAEYNDRRNAAIAAGTWHPYTDPQPVREHVHRLAAAGMGHKRVARIAGIAGSTIGKLLYADPPRTRIRTSAASAILAVRPETDIVSAADRAKLPAIGTRRRIQALATIGYGLQRQATAAGWSLANFSGLANGRRDLVNAATARAVATVYDEWSMVTLPDDAETRRVRRFAASRMWLPPLAWDDEVIDDPDGRPCVLPPVDGSDPEIDETELARAYLYPESGITPPIRLEIVRRMVAAGYSTPEIAAGSRIAYNSVSYYRQAALHAGGRAEALA